MQIGPFLDTVAGVALTAALIALGWFVKQIISLTAATAALAAQVDSLRTDHENLVEIHKFGRHARRERTEI